MAAIEKIARVAGSSLLDVHSDPWHHRSVLTLAGGDVLEAAKAVTRAALSLIELPLHRGAHPRLGAVDVVPFAPFEPYRIEPLPLDHAIKSRDAFASWAGAELGVPCLTYGPERSLPEIRRAARDGSLEISAGLLESRSGICCVGARQMLVAYNLDLGHGQADLARSVAALVRTPALRTLGFDLGGRGQVSCNLVDPSCTGPAEAYDAVAAHARIERAELVGLLPAAVLARTDPERYGQLDLDALTTLESRLARAA